MSFLSKEIFPYHDAIVKSLQFGCALDSETLYMKKIFIFYVLYRNQSLNLTRDDIDNLIDELNLLVKAEPNETLWSRYKLQLIFAAWKARNCPFNVFETHLLDLLKTNPQDPLALEYLKNFLLFWPDHKIMDNVFKLLNQNFPSNRPPAVEEVYALRRLKVAEITYT